MINLEGLVQAINESVAGASRSLREQNLAVLDEFFEEVEESDDLDALADEAIAGSSEAMDADDPEKAKAAIKKAAAAIGAAAKAMQGGGGGKGKYLRPKLVLMKYPRTTARGPEVHTVSVPLIALASVSSYQLSELKLTTQLEIELVDDKLQVSFPKRNGAGEVEPGRGTLATLEIGIDAAQPPRGLEMMVEGYERALRAQIPG